MEEGKCTLCRPLAFHPRTEFDVLQKTTGVRILETENRSLNYNFPLYDTIMPSEYFPVWIQCGSFAQPWFESAGSLTDSTQSVALEDYGVELVKSPWNVVPLFSAISKESDKPVVYNPYASESSTPDIYPSKFNAGVKTPEEKVSKIWRPFSPELDSSPSLDRVVNPNSCRNRKKTACEVSDCRFFPTIQPSAVKLGESSVFKAVKKKKYQCQYCDQWYLNSGQLAGHIRAHIGSKPYRCEYHGCSRAFARNEELTRHRRIHSGVKPHQCDTCQKRFGRKDHLNKHKKTHMKASEKKIYLCEVPGCKHRYTRSDALTRHLSTAHSIKHQRYKSGRSKQNSLLIVPSATND